MLSINTSFSGASADTVDREITASIEGAVARVQGVTGISSSSSYGRSRVTLTFADGTNLDNATSDVRDATARLVNRFPDGVDAPTIVKADSDASAIMQLSVTSETLSRDELTNLVDNQISEALAAVPGVADLQIYGEQAKVFTIDVDQSKLASLGLTVADITRGLSTIGFDTAAGTINGANQNISVRALADVTAGGGQPVPVVLVSFDPKHDDVAALRNAAEEHHVSAPLFRFTRPEKGDEGMLAGVLGVAYRALPKGGFTHNVVVALLDADGRILARTDASGKPDPAFVKAILLLQGHSTPAAH